MSLRPLDPATKQILRTGSLMRGEDNMCGVFGLAKTRGIGQRIIKVKAKKVRSKVEPPGRFAKPDLDQLVGKPPPGVQTVIRSFPTVRTPPSRDPIDRVAKPKRTPIRSPEVSIWSDLVGSFSKSVGAGITQRIATSGQKAIVAGPAVAAAAGVAGRVLPAIGRVLTGRVATGVAVGVAGAQLFDALGNPIKKRRRMNFGNARAARRAIRRIKGTRRLLKSIEDQLPRRAAPRRRQPAHHHDHHAHH